MSSPGLLCLKWNNHTSAFDKLLNNLHLRDVYSDGTIVCHGKFYPVHRFVLSTCSEYFEEIFRQSINLKSKHPFIIVKDIHPPQMEALLNYMYRGEVNVPQEMLPELIKAAEAFKIKGLAVPDDEPPPSKSSSSRDRKRSSANLSSPSSQVKKSRRVDDSSKSAKISSKSDDEIKHSEEVQTECSSSRSKNYSSSSSQKDTEELFITEIPPSEVKSEPTDLPEYNESEEIPEQTAPPEEDYLSPKELGIKDEKSFESYTTAEPFPPYEDDNLASEDQYDLAQSSSWDNSQGFEGDSNLEEGDSAQGAEEPIAPWIPSSSTPEPREVNDASQSHSTEPKFICSLCPYQSSTKQNVEKHIRMHTGEKPYQCDQCTFKTAQKENLRRHILIHSGEKPFGCPKCPYKCARKASLRIHLRVHSGEKPFGCPKCPYKCARKGTLTLHLRVHSGEKPFICPKCPYKTTQKINLKVHMLKHVNLD